MLSIDLEDQFARWRLTFIDQVKAALILTEGQLTDIYIVQHEDCGAFRFYMEKNSSDMSDNDEPRNARIVFPGLS